MFLVLPATAARFPPRPADDQSVCRAIELWIDATDEPLPVQDREHVVTELAFRGWNEGFEPIVERKAAGESLAVADDRVEVIPNFIDTKVFRPGLEPCHRATLAPDGEKIVMHISNFRSVKRVEDVVATFARLNDKVPSRLVLVGDGPDRPRALMRAEELGVRDQVLFLGKHTSVHELLSCADLFLLPSENESFGLAALEAMACGAPVVASNAGGLPEVVVDGETGYLLDIGDIDGMADSGARILGDEDHWRRLSEGARAVAVEHFSADRVVPQYEAYYDRVIKGGGE